MKVVATREIKSELKSYFNFAEKEKVVIKQGKKYMNLIVSDNPDEIFVSSNWIKEFMSIPEEYRCNPFEISPTGDLFFADKRNVKHVMQGIEEARQGKTKRYTLEEIEELTQI
jgi:hypothetical protein